MLVRRRVVVEQVLPVCRIMLMDSKLSSLASMYSNSDSRACKSRNPRRIGQRRFEFRAFRCSRRNSRYRRSTESPACSAALSTGGRPRNRRTPASSSPSGRRLRSRSSLLTPILRPSGDKPSPTARDRPYPALDLLGRFMARMALRNFVARHAREALFVKGFRASMMPHSESITSRSNRTSGL